MGDVEKSPVIDERSLILRLTSATVVAVQQFPLEVFLIGGWRGDEYYFKGAWKGQEGYFVVSYDFNPRSRAPFRVRDVSVNLIEKKGLGWMEQRKLERELKREMFDFLKAQGFRNIKQLADYLTSRKRN